MTIEREGAQLFKAAISLAQLGELERAVADQPRDHAGVRLSGISELRPLRSPTGPVGTVPVSVLGPECLPVRAILFDKSAQRNWSLGWHQDRTIAVRHRIDVDGFAWSVKSGMIHVEPPIDLLVGMVTVRVHLNTSTITARARAANAASPMSVRRRWRKPARRCSGASRLTKTS